MTTIAYVHHKDVLQANSTTKTSQAGFRGMAQFMTEAVRGVFGNLEYIAPLKNIPSVPAGLRVLTKNYGHGNYFDWAEPSLSKNYGRQLQRKLESIEVDVVLATEFKHVAYLDCAQTLVVWQDASYVQMTENYAWGEGLCQRTVRDLESLDRMTLENADIVAFPSEWAVEYARDRYPSASEKLVAIPWGANIDCDRTEADIARIREAKSTTTCKLLFCGVEWIRKGGDVALEIARRLNDTGLPTELIVVGCRPPSEIDLPEFVTVKGFIDKNDEAGQAALNALFSEAHFLMLLSKAENFGLVICEASSFGLPSIGSKVGGITSAIQDDINGKTFPSDAPLDQHCDYISGLFNDPEAYRTLAQSTYADYCARLSWEAAAKELKATIERRT